MASFSKHLYSFLDKYLIPSIPRLLKLKKLGVRKLALNFLRISLDKLRISNQFNQVLWSELTHAEFRFVFNLPNSRQLNKLITELKKKEDNELLIIMASFIILSLQGRSSIVIAKYLQVIANFNEKLTKDYMRTFIQDIERTHLEETRMGLSLVKDSSLLRFVPATIDMLSLFFVNHFSDIGKALEISSQPIVVKKFSNFNDLAKKVSRRSKYFNDQNQRIPLKFPWLEGVRFSQYQIKGVQDSKELGVWSLSLENCLYDCKEDAVREKKFFIALLSDNKVKWVAELNFFGDIVELKGIDNVSDPRGLRDELKAVIRKHDPSFG